MDTQTIWNEPVLQKEKYYIKKTYPGCKKRTERSKPDDSSNMDTSNLQLPLLKTLFNIDIPTSWSSTTSIEYNTNPTSSLIEKSGGVDEGHDVGFLLYSGEQPQGVRRNIGGEAPSDPPIGGARMNIRKVGVPTTQEGMSNNNNIFNDSGDGTKVDKSASKDVSVKVGDMDFDSDNTYDEFIQRWKKNADTFRKYNPIGMVNIIVMFIFNKLFVELFGNQFQQSFYDRLLQNYLLFLKLIIAIFVTYNLFYVFFLRYSKEHGSGYMGFLPVNNINGLGVFSFLVNWIPIIYNYILCVRDTILRGLNVWVQEGTIKKNTRYKIIFIGLFLFSIYFTTMCMETLYNAFMNCLSLEKDHFSNYILVFIILYSIFCFVIGAIQNYKVMQSTAIAIMYLIGYLLLILLSVWFVSIPTMIVCIIIFMATVFPWMIVCSTYKFEVFNVIHEFCNNSDDDIDDETLCNAFDKKAIINYVMRVGLDAVKENIGEGGLSKVFGDGVPGDLSNVLENGVSGNLSNVLTEVNNEVNKIDESIPPLTGGGGDSSHTQWYNNLLGNDNDEKCKLPKSSLTIVTEKLGDYFEFFYKKMFYFLFIILFLIHIVMYCQKIDSQYYNFRNILLCICSSFICFFLLFFIPEKYINRNFLTEHIGFFLRLFTICLTVIILIMYGTYIYQYLHGVLYQGGIDYGVDIDL